MLKSIDKQSWNPWSQSWRRKVRLWWERFAEKEGSTDPRESEILATRQLTIALKLSYYLFIIAKLFKVKSLYCLQYKNPQFTAFLDSNLHTRLAIVTENELGLAFPPRNLPKNFVPIRPRFI